MKRGWLALLLGIFLQTAHAGGIDFALTGVDGKTYRLSDYRGQWVVVNFWATWCPPCLEEIPELVDYHERHKNTDGVVIGINQEDIDEERLRTFVDDWMMTYPVVRSDDSLKAPFTALEGLPTTFIVSPQGTLVARHLGGLTATDIEDFIQRYQRKRVMKSTKPGADGA